jgi:hypothetical protein
MRPKPRTQISRRSQTRVVVVRALGSATRGGGALSQIRRAHPARFGVSLPATPHTYSHRRRKLGLIAFSLAAARVRQHWRLRRIKDFGVRSHLPAQMVQAGRYASYFRVDVARICWCVTWGSRSGTRCCIRCRRWPMMGNGEDRRRAHKSQGQTGPAAVRSHCAQLEGMKVGHFGAFSIGPDERMTTSGAE